MKNKLGLNQVYEIENSQWIEEIKTMNRTHPRHSDESFRGVRHFFIAFEDEIFECLADGVEITK